MHKHLFAVVLILAALTFSDCNKSSTSRPAASNKVRVGYIGLTCEAPIFAAIEKGFFKKYGIDITGVLTSQGGGTSVRNTLAGDLPYGEVALSAAVEAIKNGISVRLDLNPLDMAAGSHGDFSKVIDQKQSDLLLVGRDRVDVYQSAR